MDLEDDDFKIPKYEDSGIHKDICKLMALIVAYTDVAFTTEESKKFRSQYLSRLNFFLNIPESPISDNDPLWN